MFGSLHPSKKVHLILPEILTFLNDTQSHIKCVYIGKERQHLLDLLDEKVKKIADQYLLSPGFISEEEVSALYQEGAIAVSYFTDGISSRRGSAIASLQHGCPLISTFHEDYTHPLFKDKKYIYLTDVKHFEHNFSNLLKIAIDQYSTFSSDEIKSFFNENFSWDEIISTYIKTTSDIV